MRHERIGERIGRFPVQPCFRICIASAIRCYEIGADNQPGTGTSKHVDEIVIIGGPNGAGKTTAAQVMVPQSLEIREFVNADEIARGLSPFDPEHAAFAAGRLMLERIRELLKSRQNFAFETTCASRTHLPMLQRCKADGWRVTLVYLWLPSPQAALDRVARRVREGGHDIPGDVVVRRYWAGLFNFRLLYLPLADVAVIYR
jgi:predicted ABC-type ATPase